MATRIEILADHPVYLFWAGDGVMNDANAIFFVKRDGQSFFGGSLVVGFLRVQVSNNVPSPVIPKIVETGEFDTNGNPKQVTVSFSYANASVGTGTQPTPPSSVSGTITLHRKVAGGAWSIVKTAPITGNAIVSLESGEWIADIHAGGFLDFTDTNSSPGPFEYKAEVTGTGLHWGLPQSPNGHQTYTLTSTEY